MFDPLTAEFDSDELARLRREEPVSRTPSGTWFLARFDDVLAATKDPDTFIASFREPGVVVPEEEQLVSEIPRPRHGQIRRIINSAIAAHRVSRIEPFCRDLCQHLLDDILAKGGPADLVTDYVMPVPNNVIAQLLGAPRADFQLWAGWSDDVVQGTYPTKNRNERGEGLGGAHPEFVAYVDALIDSRRAAPRDDFITRLISTEVEGRRLTSVEARTQLVFLFISGNETTRHLIANVLWSLANDQDLFAQLRADRQSRPNCRRRVFAPRPTYPIPHAQLHRDHRIAWSPTLSSRQDRIRSGVCKPRRSTFRRRGKFQGRSPRSAPPFGLRWRPPRVSWGQPGPTRGSGSRGSLPRQRGLGYPPPTTPV